MNRYFKEVMTLSLAMVGGSLFGATFREVRQQLRNSVNEGLELGRQRFAKEKADAEKESILGELTAVQWPSVQEQLASKEKKAKDAVPAEANNFQACWALALEGRTPERKIEKSSQCFKKFATLIGYANEFNNPLRKAVAKGGMKVAVAGAAQTIVSSSAKKS